MKSSFFVKACCLMIFFAQALYCQMEQTPKLPFRRGEHTSPMRIGKRPRVTPHTMIYARMQPYDLYSNYLNEWIDRPLYHNRDWRNSSEEQEQGFLRDVQTVQEYEIEGFTMLGSSYVPRYRRALQTLEKHFVQDFTFMPGMAWSAIASYDKLLNNVKTAFASPYTTRVNGKVPLFSYVSCPLEKMRDFRERLAADGFTDVLLFDNLWLDMFAEYQRTGTLSENTVSKMEETIRSKLEVLDGLIFFAFHMHRDAKSDYTLMRKFDYALIEKHVAPLFEKVYSEPANAQKLLGLNLRHGYLGHMSGTNEAEYGTSQLREVFDIALLLNADILSLVEWNEANENTSFQPSVNNSRGLQRLVRFYARFLKGEAPAPNPGDDLSIPNLLISTRQTVKLGEKVRIELLNIPDSPEPLRYSAQLQLYNEHGDLLKSFAKDHFEREKLTAITYEIPSEAFVKYNAIMPILTLHYKGREMRFDNLSYTRLDPTVGWNFKEIRQPLRDLLHLPQAQITAKKHSDGNFELQVTVQSDEALASVEILDQEQEIAAFSNEAAWNPQQNRVVLLRFSKAKSEMIKLNLRIPGCADYQFSPWGRPYSGFGKLNLNQGVLQGELLIWPKGSDFLLSIPAAADAGNTEIHLTLEGYGETVLPLKTLLERRSYGVELPGPIQVHFYHRLRLPDHPSFPSQQSIVWQKRLPSRFENPCFQLRVVSRSGKIYRSRPLFPTPQSEEISDLPVFSAFSGERILLQVPSNRIPVLDYIFQAKNGTLLLNRGARRWNAENGGGFRYLYPMSRVKLPDGIKHTAPQWKQLDNNAAQLDFDGISNYVVFPMEAFPTATFTISFEAFTDSNANQSLFRHGAIRLSSLDTFIVDGKLQAAYAEMGTNFLNPVNELPVNLDFPVGRWNRVKISYDLKEFRFLVNDQECRIPCDKRPGKAGTSIFGGHYGSDPFREKFQLGYFKGSLRNFKIIHNPYHEESL